MNHNITSLLDLKHWRRIPDKHRKSEILVGVAKRCIDIVMGRVIPNIIIVIWKGGARWMRVMRRRGGTLVPSGSPMVRGSGIGGTHMRDKEMGRRNLMNFGGGGGI